MFIFAATTRLSSVLVVDLLPQTLTIEPAIMGLHLGEERHFVSPGIGHKTQLSVYPGTMCVRWSADKYWAVFFCPESFR